MKNYKNSIKLIVNVLAFSMSIFRMDDAWRTLKALTYHGG